jgi:hypothetical protein
MPELASSAIVEKMTKALDRNTAALLTVATEIAKAGDRSAGSIADWLISEVHQNFSDLLGFVQAGRQ